MTTDSQLPPLLDVATARAHLGAFRVAEESGDAGVRRSYADADDLALTQRELVNLMLTAVNDGALSRAQWAELVGGARFGAHRAPPGAPTRIIDAARRAALRAFLEERVAVRERQAAGARERRIGNELAGRSGARVSDRSAALSLAAAKLPAMLNGRVRKGLTFRNIGEAEFVIGTIADGPHRGTKTQVVTKGAGGRLEIAERFECDDWATALNLALALTLDDSRSIGSDLCRCHLESCGRFWLLLKAGSAGKPVRNYHDAECARQAKTAKAAKRQKDKRAKDAAKRASKHK